MEIKSYARDNIEVIELKGDLDGNSSSMLQEELESVVTPDCRCLVIDMKNCPFVSSAGLRALLIAAKMLKTNAGKVVLAGLSDEVEEIMEMTGFEPYFEYAESVDEYLEKTGEG